MTAIAKLFMIDGDQAVSLPDDYRFDCDEVRISRDGDKVILEPLTNRPIDPEDRRPNRDEATDPRSA